jgi:hypothetical protein
MNACCLLPTHLDLFGLPKIFICFSIILIMSPLHGANDSKSPSQENFEFYIFENVSPTKIGALPL